MSAQSTILIINSLVTILDLFGEIQRNGKLSKQALEVKIAKGKELRKHLVELANSNDPEVAKLASQFTDNVEVEDAPLGEPEASGGETPPPTSDESPATSSEPSETPSTGPSETSSSELPADLGPYPTPPQPTSDNSASTSEGSSVPDHGTSSEHPDLAGPPFTGEDEDQQGPSASSL